MERERFEIRDIGERERDLRLEILEREREI